MENEVTLLATSAMGLEAIVKREVKQLGYEPKVDNGKIMFNAPLSGIPRANLWLRTADRVKLVVGESRIESFAELYDWIYSLPWETIYSGGRQVSGNRQIASIKIVQCLRLPSDYEKSDCRPFKIKNMASRIACQKQAHYTA